MLKKATLKMISETKSIKNNIKKELSKNSVKKTTFISVPLSKVLSNNMILAPSYYDENQQIKILCEYIDKAQSLESLENTFEEIVSTGKAKSIPNGLFCENVRNIIKTIL